MQQPLETPGNQADSPATMREIVFDTETTGLDPADGHRLVEFAGIELVNRVATGRNVHVYVRPDRRMPPEAEAIHGLTDAFLADKPLFGAVADQIIDFLGDAILVAHNAPFDMRFLNAELERIGRQAISDARVVDTLDLARKVLPGAKHSLDALCLRYGIDRSLRVRHGALIDAELLADVYVELRGGRQIGLGLDLAGPALAAQLAPADRPVRAARHFAVPECELAAHAAFVASIKGALWQRVMPSAMAPD